MPPTAPSSAAAALSRGRNWIRWIRQSFRVWVERARSGEYIFLLTLAVLVGLLGGLSAIVFDLAIRLCQHGFWGIANPAIEHLQQTAAWKLALMPTLGGLGVGLVTTFLVAEAKGHGVPEVIKAVALNGGKIRGRVAVAKTIASAITIGSGGSAGREGPIIQIGAAIGSRIGQAIGMSKSCLRTLVGCGAAAGIAATFNAPVAGALFAGEVILGGFGLSRFSPIVVSSVVATLVARAWRGDAPVFTPPACTFASPWELLPYALLGLLCGLVSLAYIHTNSFLERLFDRSSALPRALKPALGGLIVGLIAIALPQIMGDGHHLANQAFATNGAGLRPLALLTALLAAKLIATSLTLGSGGSGGVFSPALTLGALLGALTGLLATPLLGIRSGGVAAYALAGMGGMVAGSMLAPITAILMVFEITNNYAIILPVMLVSILSTVLVMKANGNLSIYTMKLARDGVHLLHGASPDLLRSLSVRDHMRPPPDLLPPTLPAATLMDRLLASPSSQFYVTHPENDTLLGAIALSDARRLLLSSPSLLDILMAEDVMRRDIPALLPADTLSSTLAKFTTARLQELPVIRSLTDRRILGTLTYPDVLSAYQDEMLKADATHAVRDSLSGLATGPVELAPGFAVAEWSLPSAYVGQTLADADLPTTRNLRVLLIKRHLIGGRLETVLPNAHTHLLADDILVVLGPTPTLLRLRP